MTLIIPIVTDLVAITLLAGVLYYRRHRRRDLLLSYVALNIGVLAVTMALSSVQAGIGLGIGLFGILSIIRLRSDQITQQEIAYYFVSLALGLLAGLHPAPEWVTPALSALLLAVMAVLDSPVLLPRARRSTLTLDRAYPDERSLREVLAATLDATVQRVEVIEVDLVRDVTVVDVRYRIATDPPEGSERTRGHGVADRSRAAATPFRTAPTAASEPAATGSPRR